MRALVTGGLGYLGKHVVRGLRETTLSTRLIVRSVPDTSEESDFYCADLAGGRELDKAFDGVDVLVHMAAAMGNDAAISIRDTVEGTKRLIAAMSRSGSKRLVLASSFSVYDWARIESYLDENSPTLDDASSKSVGNYATSKVMQELLVRKAAQQNGWLLTVLRPAALWGDGVWAEFLIGPRVEPLQLVVAPTAKIRLCHVHNAAEAFTLATFRTSGPRELVINLVDDPEVTTWQHAHTVHKVSGSYRIAVPYHIAMVGARTASIFTERLTKVPYFADPLRFEALHKPVEWSNKCLREALGWTPRFDYHQAIAHEIATT